MIQKRLNSLLIDSKKYIVYQVLCQWLALVCQIVIIYEIADLLEIALVAYVDRRTALIHGGIIFVAIILRCLFVRISVRVSFVACVDVKGLLRRSIYEKLISLGSDSEEYSSSSELEQLISENVEQLDVYYGKYLAQKVLSLLVPIMLFAFVAVVIDITTAILILTLVVAILTISLLVDRVFDKRNLLNGVSIASILNLLTCITTAIGLVITLNSFCSGKIDISDALMLIILVYEFFLPIRKYGLYKNEAKKAVEAGDRIFSFLDIGETFEFEKKAEEEKKQEENDDDFFYYDYSTVQDIFKSFLVYIRPYTKYLIISILLGVIGYISNIFIPVLAIGDIESKNFSNEFYFVLLGLAVAGGLFSWAGEYCSRKISDKVLLYALTIIRFITALIVSGIVTVFMIQRSVIAGLVALLGYYLVGVIVPFLNCRGGKRYGAEVDFYLERIKTSVSVYISEKVKDIDLLESNIKNVSVFQKKLNRCEARQKTFVEMIKQLIILAVLLIVVWQVGYGAIYPIDCLLVIAIALSSFGPVESLADLSNDLNVVMASSERVLAALEEESKQEEETKPGEEV
ncbi:MAG: ABC transporter ATP-binding protein [Eubacterium sp.]|nr:ABC transporter ATP-binding protein [Eubacterium sp.]